MSTPDEVICAMAEAACSHDGLLCLSCESAGECLRLVQFEGQKAIVQAALVAAEALGWRMVPVEPTHEMRDEGIVARAGSSEEPYHKQVLRIYRAMLAAAPKATP